MRIYRVIPCSHAPAHFVRRGGDCTTRGIPAMAATMTTALCAAVPTRVDRAHATAAANAGPRPKARDAPSRATWSGPRLALSAPARDDRERVRRPRSRVAAVERASTWALPRRAGWRRERAPPRASRGAPRAGRTREPNRGGASSRASREESRGGGERVRAKRGLRVHPQLLQPVSDRRHALATRFTPRRRLRARSTRPRVFEIARTPNSKSRVFFFFFTKKRLTRRLRCPFSTHADATTT